MNIKNIKEFIKNNKSTIIGEKITSILLCGSLFYNADGSVDVPFNSLEEWKGPLILKTTSHQLEFDASAYYFSVSLDSININKIIEIEDIPAKNLDKIKDIFNASEYLDISYMFTNTLIGKSITNISSLINNFDDPEVVITLEDFTKIAINNGIDWVSIDITQPPF